VGAPKCLIDWSGRALKVAYLIEKGGMFKVAYLIGKGHTLNRGLVIFSFLLRAMQLRVDRFCPLAVIQGSTAKTLCCSRLRGNLCI
jgi:hypothetical protein